MKPIGWFARIAAVMVAITISTAAAVGVYSYYRMEASALPGELVRLEQVARDRAEALTRYVDGTRLDLLRLLNLPMIDAFVRAERAGGVDPLTGTRAEVWRDRIADTFLDTLAADSTLDQLRLIAADAPGRELVRVDHAENDRDIRLTPAQALQNKGHREYLQEAAALDPGRVFVSPVELNRERGEIDPRQIPVMRVAAPVHSADGAVFGVLVANLDMRPVIDELRRTKSNGSNLYLVDSAGRILMHPDQTQEFLEGAALPAGLAAFVDGSANAAEVLSAAGERVGAAAATAMLAGTQPVSVVVTLAYDQLIGPVATLGRSVLAATAAACLVAIALAIIFSRTLTQPLSQMTRAVASASGAAPSHPAPVHAAGEIGVLARAFEVMRSEVRSKQSELTREVEERRQAEERFRLAVEACPSGMIIVDARGIIELANSETCTMFGWAAEELVGQSVEVLVPREFRDHHPQLRGQYLEDPSTRLMGEGRDLFGLRRDGEMFAVEIALNPIATDSGRKVLIVVADITERKASEQLIAQRTEDLERSNAELEQFAYVASHDLQEPLRIVASYAELFAERYHEQLDERAEKYLHYIVDGARRMQRMVNDLLQFSRVGTQGREPAPTDSSRVLADVLNSMGEILDGAGARVCIGEMPVVRSDELQLARVFQNLISNAVKFSPAPRVHIECQRDGPFWRFLVADNGIGIEPGQEERVFQMFQRLHGRGEYEGSGIGLPIVRKIVERHGGRVWFESQAGQGSTFFFTLPAEEKLG